MNAPGADGERVRQAVAVLTELLIADHLKPAPAPAPAAELEAFNELGQMARRMRLEKSRFGHGLMNESPRPRPPSVPPRGRRSLDASSPVFLVDHTACILCDRCSRACDEVKQNHIIGRTGKGATAGIGFDLNLPMGDSGCVQCGECMVSCPTSAITFRPVAQVNVGDD
jgi:predicted molibdopterin-dependent oxidoreductase YjgC